MYLCGGSGGPSRDVAFLFGPKVGQSIKMSVSQSKCQSVNQKWSLCTSVAVLASPSPDVAFSFGSKSQSVNQKVNQSVKVNQKKVKTKQRNNHEESQSVSQWRREGGGFLQQVS